MRAVRILSLSLFFLAYCGMLLPVELLASEPRQAPRLPEVSPTIIDIALYGGRLAGTVQDGSAAPVVGESVVAIQNQKIVGRAVTGKHGEFVLAGLRAGLSQVVIGDTVQVCRCWSPDAAPPAAQPRLLIASDAAIIRGQRPISDLLFADPLIFGLVVAAAIAIPIAVHNSGNDRPSGS